MNLHRQLWLVLLLIGAPRIGPQLAAQEVAVLAVDTIGEEIRIQCIVKGVAPHVQTRLALDRRWSGSTQSVPTRLDGRRHQWVPGEQVLTLTAPILDPVLGSDGQNLVLRIHPDRTRIHPVARWLTMGFGALSFASRQRSQRAYEGYLNATQPDAIEAEFQAAQSAHRTSVLSGGLTVGLLGTWAYLAHQLSRPGRAPATEIALLPSSGDWIASTDRLSTPCRFETSGRLPDSVQTAQIVVVQQGPRCPSTQAARSRWQSTFSEAFDIVARDRELEDVILQEQRLWLGGIISDEWQQKVGHLSGSQFTLLGQCASDPKDAELRIIDNVTGQLVWQAMGCDCDADRFAESVRLQIQRLP